MKELERLESELYGEDKKRPILGRGFGKIKNYFLKPSTHGGFYLSGIGCFVGGLGGLVREIGLTAYSEGPDIVTKISSGMWYEAGCQLVASATRMFLNSAYIAGAGGCIGYIGGTIITGKICDTISSFFRIGKKHQEVK